jgi:peptide/nickel transport system substrate-binding protein
MEHRFTVRDFFLFVFLSVLLIFTLLAMYMVDRQWQKMAQMEKSLGEQAADLRRIRSMLGSIERRVSSGEPLRTGNGESDVGRPAVPAAFERAHAASRRPDFRAGDWLVQAFGTSLKTITPLVSSDIYASQVQTFVLESLLIRDPETLAWEGLVAEDGWEVGEDGLTLVFRLRKGVTFSDGHALEAEDAAFTFDFIMNEAIAVPRARAYFEKIESVSARNSREVVFRFKEPYFDSLSLAGGMPILAKHFYRRYLKSPETFNQSKGFLFGSGPYRLSNPETWTPDQGFVELERNVRYWGPVQPPFDRLLWKIIENDSARLTTFRNGDIDVYNARPLEFRQLIQDAALNDRVQHFEYMSPTAGYLYIGWNQVRGGKSTRFADQRVRQAMTYLTDRQRIIEEILLGYAEPAVSPFSPGSPQHDPALSPRVYDPVKAKVLLHEAGYADRDGDGVLEDVEGRPFDFELVFLQDNEDTKRLVLFLRDLYARAGIMLRPKPTEWSVMLDLLDEKNFDAITLGWSSGIETDLFQMFHSSQTLSGGDNFINYRNPRLDKLIEQARATVDEKTRMPLWHWCERILYDDQPYTFLLRRKTLAFIDARMHNVQVTHLGLNLNTVPVEWFVPGPLQKYTH